MSQQNSTRILRALTGRVYAEKKSIDDPVTAILTYPLKDYAGDYVQPDGGDWSPFEKYPIINWSHRVPIGRGIVTHKALTFEGKTTPVAVGESIFFTKASDYEGVDLTKFDDPNIRNKIGEYSVQECLDIARQAKSLVYDDIATGVSIEFSPNGKKGEAYWDLEGTSALEGRPPRHFKSWWGYTYAHAKTPVNPGCRTLLQDENDTIAKSYEIARTGMWNGDKIHPMILKAFTEDDDLLVAGRRFYRADDSIDFKNLHTYQGKGATPASKPYHRGAAEKEAVSPEKYDFTSLFNKRKVTGDRGGYVQEKDEYGNSKQGKEYALGEGLRSRINNTGPGKGSDYSVHLIKARGTNDHYFLIAKHSRSGDREMTAHAVLSHDEIKNHVKKKKGGFLGRALGRLKEHLMGMPEEKVSMMNIKAIDEMNGEMEHVANITPDEHDEDGEEIKSFEKYCWMNNDGACDNTPSFINKRKPEFPSKVDLAAGGYDLLRQIAAGWFNPNKKCIQEVIPIIKGIADECHIPFRQAAVAFKSSLNVRGIKVKGGNDSYWDFIDQIDIK